MSSLQNKVLQIDSSLFGDNGVSSQLSKHLVEQLAARSDIDLLHKQFAHEPVPHFDGNHLSALMTPELERSPEQQAMVAYSDGLIAELQAANSLVLGLPMYNFDVPSMMKAWFDHVARAGVTFRYTETGSEGLLKNKKAYLLMARGGLHKGSDRDTETGFVRTFLNFIGITDVTIIYAEGTNMGDEIRSRAISEAKAEIDTLQF